MKPVLTVNEPVFRKLECLDFEEQYYEIEMAKNMITGILHLAARET